MIADRRFPRSSIRCRLEIPHWFSVKSERISPGRTPERVPAMTLMPAVPMTFQYLRGSGPHQIPGKSQCLCREVGGRLRYGAAYPRRIERVGF